MDRAGIEPAISALQKRYSTTKLPARIKLIVDMVGIGPTALSLRPYGEIFKVRAARIELATSSLKPYGEIYRVGDVGIEPTTSSLSETRSSTELVAHSVNLQPTRSSTELRAQKFLFFIA